MILYVNGDSHSAGAEAVNTFCFAEDDPLYYSLGRIPHPDNERASYGCEIANMMGAILHCDAESASSNSRIIRTTIEYLETETPDYVIIGWSTWEREEWLHEGTYWQVNAGGIGHDWPKEIQDRYKSWICDLDFYSSMKDEHQSIYILHQMLKTKNIKHLFFNSFDSFNNVDHFDWGMDYLEPYNRELTYYNWCKAQGYKTVTPTSYHFGADAHRAWADFLYQNIIYKALTT
jgi:hypothetical protein